MSLMTLFAVVLLPVLLGLTGLVADGGQVLVARREVQGLAESAAHAGATQLDTTAARANPDQPAPIDPRAAELAAARYLAIQEPGLSATVRADTQQVVVHVTSRPIPMTFLRVAGIMQVQVAADATAEPRTGVASAQR
jgi:Flp pilus assembly protein TadG